MKVYVPKMLNGKELDRARTISSLAANRGKPYDVQKPGAKTLARMEKAKAKATA